MKQKHANALFGGIIAAVLIVFGIAIANELGVFERPQVHEVWAQDPDNPFGDRQAVIILIIQDGYVLYMHESNGITGSADMHTFRVVYDKVEK
jgi:hypothetical protein